MFFDVVGLEVVAGVVVGDFSVVLGQDLFGDGGVFAKIEEEFGEFENLGVLEVVVFLDGGDAAAAGDHQVVEVVFFEDPGVLVAECAEFVLPAGGEEGETATLKVFGQGHGKALVFQEEFDFHQEMGVEFR